MDCKKQSLKGTGYRRKDLLCEAEKFQSDAQIGFPEVLQGPYKYIRLLGSGSFGSVFEVESSLDHKKYAIKYLTDKSDAQKEVGMMRFIRPKSKCPKALPCYVDHYKDKIAGHYAIVQTLGPGEPLNEAFQNYKHARGGKYKNAAEACVHIMIDLFEAVKFLHSRKIIHGDIKPENIMVDVTSGNVMLLDLGGSCVSLDKTGYAKKCGNGVSYTKVYISPELLDIMENKKGIINHIDIAKSNDVYALGLTLTYMISGGNNRYSRNLRQEHSPLSKEVYRALLDGAKTKKQKNALYLGIVQYNTTEKKTANRASVKDVLRALRGNESGLVMSLGRFTNSSVKKGTLENSEVYEPSTKRRSTLPKTIKVESN